MNSAAYWHQQQERGLDRQVQSALREAGYHLERNAARDSYILEHRASGGRVELEASAVHQEARSSHPINVISAIVRLAKKKLAAVQAERTAEEQRRQKQLAEARKPSAASPRTDTEDADVLWIEPPPVRVR